MRRREVLAGLSLVLAKPLAARAQQPLPVVGFLSGRSAAESASVVAAFQRGLAEAGFSMVRISRSTTAGARDVTRRCPRWPPS